MKSKISHGTFAAANLGSSLRMASYALLRATLGAILGATLLLPTIAQAQIREREFKLGFQSPRGNATGEGADKFAESLAKRSGGKMKLNVFPGGALGGDVQTMSAVRAGTVDMTSLSAGLLVSHVKEFSLLDLPYLFESHEESFAVVDGPFGAKLGELLAPKGMVIIGWGGGGFRHLTNNKRPVAKLEDVKGLKIRVLQSPLFIDLFKGFGANAVPMPFPELYTALEQGAVDGQENPAPLLVAVKFNEVQKHLSLTRHIYLTAVTVMSKVVWDQLNGDERRLIVDSLKDAQSVFREGGIRDETNAIAALRKSMNVVDVSPAEIARFRAAAKPVVDKFTGDADPAVVKLLFAEIEKFRAKK